MAIFFKTNSMTANVMIFAMSTVRYLWNISGICIAIGLLAVPLSWGFWNLVNFSTGIHLSLEASYLITLGAMVLWISVETTLDIIKNGWDDE